MKIETWAYLEQWPHDESPRISFDLNRQESAGRYQRYLDSAEDKAIYWRSEPFLLVVDIPDGIAKNMPRDIVASATVKTADDA